MPFPALMSLLLLGLLMIWARMSQPRSRHVCDGAGVAGKLTAECRGTVELADGSVAGVMTAPRNQAPIKEAQTLQTERLQAVGEGKSLT